MKRDGDVWLRNGWKEFANYLSLEKEQFLVFEYEEKSLFHVIVLGTNDSEIKYPSLKEGETVNESEKEGKKMKTNTKEEPEWYSILNETKLQKKKFHAGFVTHLLLSLITLVSFLLPLLFYLFFLFCLIVEV